MIIRFVMLLVAAVVAVVLLKAVVAVAIVAIVAFGCLFAFNVVRRAVLGSAPRRRMGAMRRMRRVTPLAKPNISVRR